MKHTDDFDIFLREVVNLNQSRLDQLNSRVATVTKFLKKNLDSFDRVERQGSYALRTFIKPVNETDEYDADIQLHMTYSEDKTPKDYISELRSCFLNSGVYKDIVHLRTRCVCLDYAEDFHLDIVPCVTKPDGSKWVCNRKTDEFEETDGTGFRDWFNEKTRITHGNLKRVTRLLKFLRDHKRNFTVKSILLTTLIGQTVGNETDGDHFKNVPDALQAVSNRINDFLQCNEVMPLISNPVLPCEDFNRHWDQTKYENFRSKFASYCEKINQAILEEDHDKSIRKWRAIFGEEFGTLLDDNDGQASQSTRKQYGDPSIHSVTPTRPHLQ